MTMMVTEQSLIECHLIDGNTVLQRAEMVLYGGDAALDKGKVLKIQWVMDQ